MTAHKTTTWHANLKKDKASLESRPIPSIFFPMEGKNKNIQQRVFASGHPPDY
jgi:hypothetical protein